MYVKFVKYTAHEKQVIKGGAALPWQLHQTRHGGASWHVQRLPTRPLLSPASGHLALAGGHPSHEAFDDGGRLRAGREGVAIHQPHRRNAVDEAERAEREGLGLGVGPNLA